MRALFIVLLVSVSVVGNAQDRRILGTFLFERASYNYELTQEEERYVFRISQLASSSTGVVESGLEEFSQEAFEDLFRHQLSVRFGKSRTAEMDRISAEVFYRIKLRLETLDDTPITAYLILKRDYVKSLLRENTSPHYHGRLNEPMASHYVKRLSVEIADGAIKNITAKLLEPSSEAISNQSPRKYLDFKNQFPFSISGKFDAESFSRLYLYCIDCNSIEGLTRYVKLSDLVALDIVLENYKEDYSPGDVTVTLTPESPIQELKKEPRTRLFELTVFSDFAGFSEGVPNGLLQLEARRRFNLNTRYSLLGKNSSESLASVLDLNSVEELERTTDGSKRKVTYTFRLKADTTNFRSAQGSTGSKTLKVPRNRYTYSNWFGQWEPRLLFSKLDENNRFLEMASSEGNQVNPVALYQYQLGSLGVNLQVYRLSFPQLKFSWTVLDGGVYWFHTQVSVDQEEAVALNSSYLRLGTHFQFFPDSRWGARLGFDYLNPSIWNPDFVLRNSHALLQPQVDGFLRTNEYDRFFLRFRWTYEHQNRDNNFVQFQVGYSKNLFEGLKVPQGN